MKIFKRKEILQEPRRVETWICHTAPVWEMKVDAKQEYRHSVRQIMEQEAFELCVPSPAGIRDLVVSDLGLQSWRTPPQARNDRTPWIRHESRGIIVLYKVTQLSYNPKVSEILIGKGRSMMVTFGLHDIQSLYSLLPILRRLREFKDEEAKQLSASFGDIRNIMMEAYFSEPYLFRPKEVIAIDITSSEHNKLGDKLMLGGFILEVAGETLR